MANKAFGSKELYKCLKKLGFIILRQSSSHVMLTPPNKREWQTGARAIMTLQLGRKTFGKNSSNRYISQLKKYGFTKEEIEKLI